MKAPPHRGEPSLVDRRDASSGYRRDASRTDAPNGAAAPACRWCGGPCPPARADIVYCSQRCRQTAWRARRENWLGATARRALRVCYADPPYPGFARALYGMAEVDHAALIARLVAEYDGWALSTSARALRDLLPLCPAAVRVCAWVKPIAANPRSRGIHNTWEPVLVMPARRLRPGRRDWLYAQPARRGGDLPGRKPLAFARWLFGVLGLRRGDTLVDLYPGTGIITRAWRAVAEDLGDG